MTLIEFSKLELLFSDLTVNVPSSFSSRVLPSSKVIISFSDMTVKVPSSLSSTVLSSSKVIISAKTSLIKIILNKMNRKNFFAKIRLTFNQYKAKIINIEKKLQLKIDKNFILCK